MWNMKTPIQIHNERKERRKLESFIKENSKEYERTLDETARRNLIYLHRQYEIKFGRCYKG